MTPANQPAIDCPTGLFPAQEQQIAAFTAAINRERRAAAKAPHAQALIEAVEGLLDCSARDENNPDCQICQQVSLLRRKTAVLVLRAAQVDQRRQGQA